MLRAGTVAVSLAANEPTEVITATGPGKSTAERIPMSIFRRTGRSATFVWAVALDGAAVALQADAGDLTTVHAAGWTVEIDFPNSKIHIKN